jgi:hypothetical protein
MPTALAGRKRSVLPLRCRCSRSEWGSAGQKLSFRCSQTLSLTAEKPSQGTPARPPEGEVQGAPKEDCEDYARQLEGEDGPGPDPCSEPPRAGRYKRFSRRRASPGI